MMRYGETESFEAHVNRVMFQLLPLIKTQDSKEGMRAFMQKREPEFKGR